MSYKGLKYLFGLFLAAAMGACKKDNKNTPVTPPQYDKNYYGRQSFVIALGSTYQGFDSALKKTGYIDTLAAPGPYTTFLVDNNAVGWISDLPANVDFLLRSLIVPGDYALQRLPFGRNQRLTTLAGNHLYVTKYPYGTDSATYLVNGMPVYTADLPATNGHFNVIDQALPNIERYSSVLSYVQSSPDLTFFSLALTRTGLDKMLADTTKSWTLLAPVDGAFKKSADPSLNSYDGMLAADTARLARLLRYHIIGDRYFFADFNQLLADAGGDTAAIRPVLADAQPIKVYLNNSVFPARDFLIGAGNWDNSTNPPTPHPAGAYTPSYGSFVQDQVTINGVVHEIDNLLLP